MRKIGLLVILAVLVWGVGRPSAQAADSERRINAHYVTVPDSEGRLRIDQGAVFWFGEVDDARNYADVRVGYNDTHLVIRVDIFDHWLWYDESADVATLTAWDAVTLYLDTAGGDGEAITAGSFRFEAQLNHWQPRDSYQMAYVGDHGGWTAVEMEITTDAGWRADGLNGVGEGRGWTMRYDIPFASLGVAGPPHGAAWGLGVAVHDRDDAAGSEIPDQVWPEGLAGERPSSWGTLHFGLPGHTPPPAAVAGDVMIRHKLNGANVIDGHVGGNTNCGVGIDYWMEWGDTSYPGADQVNVQSQLDVADWPCFSKFYVTFPLDQVPAGSIIVSAEMTMHLFGNANPSEAFGSLIQASRVGADWQESSLTWNNAPPALENVAATWVEPVTEFPGWPGVPYSWDVGRAVAQAHAVGEPLRLALYSSDGAYHSGKYFSSSDTGDWNAEARPTLTVTWGAPVEQDEHVYLPLVTN